MTHTLVDVGGYRLDIRIVGAGHPAAVCVAALGHAHDPWRDVASLLADRTTAVTYGRPGLGGSDRLTAGEAAIPCDGQWIADPAPHAPSQRRRGAPIRAHQRVRRWLRCRPVRGGVARRRGGSCAERPDRARPYVGVRARTGLWNSERRPPGHRRGWRHPLLRRAAEDLPRSSGSCQPRWSVRGGVVGGRAMAAQRAARVAPATHPAMSMFNGRRCSANGRND